MAITLADVQVNVQDHLSTMVIDEFRKNNYLLDNMTFEDCVSPTGGGATMTYSYTRVDTQATAATRAINTEYTAQHAKKKRYSVDLKVFGGSFEIDRVLADMGGIVDEVTFQMQQKIKAAQALFSDMAINGDKDKDPNGFEGLDKALKGSATEMTESIDLTSSELVTANYLQFLDVIDAFLGQMDGAPTALLGNGQMIAKIRAAARRASMYQTTKDNWGQQVEYYGNIPLINLGAKAGSNDPIIANGADGTSPLYAVRLGLDGFHGVSMAGVSPIKTWMPDFNTAGAVKKGEVEMVAAVALKASKAAAVLRGVKVAG